MDSCFEATDADKLEAPVQSSFTLQKPVSMLVAHTARLEQEIFDEIQIPNTKVSIISMYPLSASNLTHVVYCVLPNASNAPIALLPLSILRSSLIELVLQQLNLTLTRSIFGQPSSFEVLKFPGVLTLIPGQSPPIWQRPQILFNFTLSNSISQIHENADRLKVQLKHGLQLRSYEGFVMNVRPSEAEAGFDVRLPPTADPDLVKKRISEEWAPATRNKTFQLIQRGPIRDNMGRSRMTPTKGSDPWWSVFEQGVIASGGKLAKPEEFTYHIILLKKKTKSHCTALYMRFWVPTILQACILVYVMHQRHHFILVTLKTPFRCSYSTVGTFDYDESVQNDQAKVYIQWKTFGLHSKGPTLELKNGKMYRKRELEVNSLAWPVKKGT